jgi:8-oxo-dGTP diphosphatase
LAYFYPYPRASLTVDAVIFKRFEDNYQVLLIERDNPPFKGKWALPGGFLDMHETLEEAVVRELQEETSLSGIELEQLHAFSSIDRDPRGRTISVIFWGILENKQEAKAGDDASKTHWYDINNLPSLAFDHDEVLQLAIRKLQKP